MPHAQDSWKRIKKLKSEPVQDSSISKDTLARPFLRKLQTGRPLQLWHVALVICINKTYTNKIMSYLPIGFHALLRIPCYLDMSLLLFCSSCYECQCHICETYHLSFLKLLLL